MGIVWGAGKLSELISYSSENLKNYVQPEEQKAIDPKWQKTAEVARNVSGKAVQVSGYLCKLEDTVVFLSCAIGICSVVHKVVKM